MRLSKAQTKDGEDGKRWSMRFCCVFPRTEAGKSPGSKGLTQSIKTVTYRENEQPCAMALESSGFLLCKSHIGSKKMALRVNGF